MQYEYFYGAQAEQFSFYRIPKALFTEPNFRELSTDAKVLYGILLDRMSLSLKNQWLDAQNKVYIIFTVEEIMDALNCANQKATRLMVELEKQAGLIERKRQGLGRPNLIYTSPSMAPMFSQRITPQLRILSTLLSAPLRYGMANTWSSGPKTLRMLSISRETEII